VFPLDGGKRAGPMRLRGLESDTIGDGPEASGRPPGRRTPMKAIGRAVSLLLVSWGWTPVPVGAAEPFTTTIEQITFGPRHHFFGYFGHARTIPWNASGRYIVALRTAFQDRMPAPGEAAEIVLLDARDGYAPRVVDRTRAWNFQQGTMLYWN